MRIEFDRPAATFITSAQLKPGVDFVTPMSRKKYTYYIHINWVCSRHKSVQENHLNYFSFVSLGVVFLFFALLFLFSAVNNSCEMLQTKTLQQIHIQFAMKHNSIFHTKIMRMTNSVFVLINSQVDSRQCTDELCSSSVGYFASIVTRQTERPQKPKGIFRVYIAFCYFYRISWFVHFYFSFLLFAVLLLLLPTFFRCRNCIFTYMHQARWSSISWHTTNRPKKKKST